MVDAARSAVLSPLDRCDELRSQHHVTFWRLRFSPFAPAHPTHPNSSQFYSRPIELQDSAIIGGQSTIPFLQSAARASLQLPKPDATAGSLASNTQRCCTIQPSTLSFKEFLNRVKLAAANGRTAVARCTNCSRALHETCS
jgi:hypothetical protein